ncbi:cupredoxin domain-containing protein [Porticoccaceae bacterium]|nr:cupredoxin domain-containing protein [Porticoccaceae bacterium]
MKSLIPIIIASALSSIAAAATPVIEITIKDHLFYPAELVLPADTKVKLLIHNSDPTPEEFESYELNREKVITGNSRAVIFVGPLKPGTYPFFGEFYPKTAQGKILVQ